MYPPNLRLETLSYLLFQLNTHAKPTISLWTPKPAKQDKGKKKEVQTISSSPDEKIPGTNIDNEPTPPDHIDKDTRMDVGMFVITIAIDNHTFN